jgi:UDP-N-acetylglucosamine 2-epimerase (non-hydrolysing)
MIDHVSSINLPYSEHARSNLLREGIHPKRIYMTGSPIQEVYQLFEREINESGIIQSLELEGKAFLLASLHRQENVDNTNNLEVALTQLSAAAQKVNMDVILSLHPRTRSRLSSLGNREFKRINMLEPLGFFDYCKLQLESACVISDSGSISEEASILGFSAVTWRNANERPEAMEAASIVPCAFPNGDIASSISLAMLRGVPSNIPAEYQVLNFSERVLNALFSALPVGPEASPNQL